MTKSMRLNMSVGGIARIYMSDPRNSAIKKFRVTDHPVYFLFPHEIADTRTTNIVSLFGKLSYGRDLNFNFCETLNRKCCYRHITILKYSWSVNFADAPSFQCLLMIMFWCCMLLICVPQPKLQSHVTVLAIRHGIPLYAIPHDIHVYCLCTVHVLVLVCIFQFLDYYTITATEAELVMEFLYSYYSIWHLHAFDIFLYI